MIEEDMMDLEVDKLKYQKNKPAYILTLFSMIWSVIGLFKTINFHSYSGLEGEMKVIPDIMLALEILLSIIVILVTFLTAENIKFYKLKWSYVLLGVSMYQGLRIFGRPLHLFRTNQIPNRIFVAIIIYFVIASVCGIWAFIITYKKGVALEKYMKKVG